MRKKSKKEIKSIDDIEVKLRPLGKIRPGVYLTVIYAFIIVLLVFFFLFLPGIRNHGAEVTFVSIPENCSVYVDGKLAGVTPFTAFIPSGGRKIEFKKLHFETETLTYPVPGRLFGSLIFSKKDSVSARLRIQSPEKLIEETFSEYAAWSGIDNFHSRYQPPPVLSEMIHAAYLGESGFDAEKISSFLTSCIEYSTDEVLLKDLLRAYFLTITKGKTLTSHSLTAALGDIASMFAEFPNLPFWLASQLSEDNIQELTKTQWYIGRLKAYEEALKNTEEGMVSGPVGADQIFLEELRFVQIPGGTYTLGDVRKNSFPVIFSTGNFFIASDEVSCALYGRFLEENPEYRPENRGKLVEEGKVSEDYLQDWETLKGSNLPVSSVSYYAASAYCSWLASKLPERMQDSHTVRLPQEYEWEVAALFSDTADPVLFETGIDGPRPVGTGRQSAAGVDGSVLKNMYGNLWEWCDNWYGANNFIYYDWKGNYRNRQTYPALEKCVRGGSWAVMQELVTIRSRGSQPAQWCTPFLGFRPVIVQK